VKRHGGLVVLDLLAESIGQPSEPPHAHPHREVLALHEARGDMGRVGVAREPSPPGDRVKHQ
jgi:hypothetical protein